MLDSVIEEADTGQSRRADAWQFGVLVTLALGALVVLHAVLNRELPSPQIFADEGGYLGNARYLVSGYGRPGNGYYAGYSLFLTPAALVTHAASTFYRGVLLTNAGLSILSPLLALVLVRQTFKDAPRWVSLMAAGVVAFSPLVFTFAGLAMSENALVPVVLAVAVLIAHAAREESVPFVGLASAMAAFAYWVSPRGVIVVLAAFVALVLLARELRRYLPVIGTATIVMAVGLGLGQLFENAVKGNRKIAGVTDRKSPLLPSLVDPSNWHKWLANALGRLAYVGFSSVGLTVIGLAVAAGWWIGRDHASVDPARRVRRCVGAFAFAAPVVTLVASAAGIATRVDARQIDLWYYGRYTDAVAMPALAIGAGWLLSNPSRIRAARAAVLAGVLIALAAIAVPVLDNSRPNESHFNRLNVIALLPIQQAFGHPTLTYQLLIGAAVAAVLGVLISTKAWIFGLVTIIVLASSALFIHARYIEPGSVGSARQDALADAVRVLHEHGVSVECIELDHTNPRYTSWNEYNYRFLLPSTRFEAIGGSDAVNCGPLVISANPDFDVVRPDARLVSIENDANMWLWIELSELAPRARDDLTRAGVFFPGSPCARLPKDAYKAALAARVSGTEARPLDLESLELDLDIFHVGRGSPWLGSRARFRSDGCGRVRVSVTVSDEDGAVVYRNVIGLPRTLFPGQGVHVRAKLAATSGPVPTLRAGHTYKLRARLEQVGVHFFRLEHPVIVSLTS